MHHMINKSVDTCI